MFIRGRCHNTVTNIAFRKCRLQHDFCSPVVNASMHDLNDILQPNIYRFLAIIGNQSKTVSLKCRKFLISGLSLMVLLLFVFQFCIDLSWTAIFELSNMAAQLVSRVNNEMSWPYLRCSKNGACGTVWQIISLRPLTATNCSRYAGVSWTDSSDVELDPIHWHSRSHLLRSPPIYCGSADCDGESH